MVLVEHSCDVTVFFTGFYFTDNDFDYLEWPNYLMCFGENMTFWSWKEYLSLHSVMIPGSTLVIGYVVVGWI